MTEAEKEDIRRRAISMTEKLVAAGRVIEGGWVGFMVLAFPDAKVVSPVQYVEMRKAFYAGALHLFSSMLAIMDSEAEPTEADMRRMDLISNELKAFGAELEPGKN